jgi:uncharacterized delta-60 repeat protein
MSEYPGITIDFTGNFKPRYGASNDSAKSIFLIKNSKLIVIGTSYTGSESGASIACVNLDGTIDNSFNSYGKFTIGSSMSTGFSSENIVFLSDTVINLLSEDGVLYSSTPFKLNYSNYYLNKIQCDINGRFIAVGSANYNSYQGSIQDFIVCRFNKNGTLDNSFGTEGSVVTDFGYSDYADGVAIQNDGKILVVGSSRNGDFQSDFALARYLENGVLDQTFGVGGQVMINLGTLDQARSVMELPDGKIIIIGGDNKSYNPNIAIVRLNQNGTFDTSFGNNGVVSTDLGGSESGWGGQSSLMVKL